MNSSYTTFGITPFCWICISAILIGLSYTDAVSQSSCSYVHVPHDGNTSGCGNTGQMTLKLTTRVTGCNPLPCGNIHHTWFTAPTGGSTVVAHTSKSLCNGNPPELHTTEVTVGGNADYWVQAYNNGAAIGVRTHVKGRVTPITSNFHIKVSGTYRNPYCEGTPVTLTAHGGSQYQWYKVNGESRDWRGSGSSFTTTEAGTYVLEGVDNCNIPQSRTSPPLNFVPSVGPVSTPTSDSFCHGAKTTSTSFATAANALGFNWTITGSGNSVSGGGGMVFNQHTGKMESTTTVNWSPAFTGSATITVRAYGCEERERTAQNTMAVHPIPESTITPSEPLIACGDDYVQISALAGLNYEWYYNGLLQTNETGQSINAYQTGKYSLRVRSNANCYSPFNDFNVKHDYEVDRSLLCDDVLNWIETTSLDETETPYSNNRRYFDFAAKFLQSQTKTFEQPVVFGSQVVRDQYDRATLSTLPAPTMHPNFKFKYMLMLNEAATAYGISDFDTPSTLYNPNPVGNTSPGTVGWYYSENNTLEENVPVTHYPYSRAEFYEDGTGERKRSASPGNFHRLGKGHEIVTGTFPVHSELANYSQRLTELSGLLGSRSLSKGIQSVMRDENGEYALSITDKEGRTVMTARKGSQADHLLRVNNNILLQKDPDSPDAIPFTYFYLLEPTAVSLSSAYFIAEDVLYGVRKNPGETFAVDGKWPAGFYKIELSSLSTTLTISYVAYFSDISYQFYDDVGRLRYSVSPNGCEKWISGAASFSTIDKTEYVYNHQGWLLRMNEPDAGITEYMYRRDGKIRFSQNAQQKQDRTFSYTNYDALGRPVESGQYTLKAGEEFTSLNSRLAALHDEWIDWNGTKTDWIRTSYDETAQSIPGISGTSLRQTFLRGAVSFTQNENSTTWYSYDEQGRVTWTAQKPNALGLTFLSEYTYDFLGNVLTVSSASYNSSGIQADVFYHHYEYDKDKRLQKAYTSLDGINKKLRATYHYYLHGPLKRIELADQLQGIDFVYNINGWLTQINDPDTSKDPGGDGPQNGFRKDAFGMVIDYYESSLQGLFPLGHQSTDLLKIHHLPALESGGGEGIASVYQNQFEQLKRIKDMRIGNGERLINETKTN